MNFYEVLGVGRDADDPTIRSAYRLLARRYHPDSGTGSNSEKFREAAEAYETLIHPGRRQGYDLTLHPPERLKPIRVEPTRSSRAPIIPNQHPFGGLTHDPFLDLIRLFETDLFFLLRPR